MRASRHWQVGAFHTRNSHGDWRGPVPPIFLEPWDHQWVGPLQLLTMNIN